MMDTAVVLLVGTAVGLFLASNYDFFGVKNDVVVLDDAFGVSVGHRRFLGLKAVILCLFFGDKLVGDWEVGVFLVEADVGEKNLIAGRFFDHWEVAERVSKVFSFSLAE